METWSLSTCLIKNFCVSFPTSAAQKFLWKLNLSFKKVLTTVTKKKKTYCCSNESYKHTITSTFLKFYLKGKNRKKWLIYFIWFLNGLFHCGQEKSAIHKEKRFVLARAENFRQTVNKLNPRGLHCSFFLSLMLWLLMSVYNRRICLVWYSLIDEDQKSRIVSVL